MDESAYAYPSQNVAARTKAQLNLLHIANYAFISAQMQETRSNTVILAFVRSPQEEARCKPLLQQASYARRLRLACLLNERACKVARQTGLPLLVIDSEQQQGQGFGQRFANALQQAFDKGYEQVIALGNDCLQLAPEHLLQAEKGLQMAPIVLGPATDGGIYLLGLHRRAFDPSSLIDLPWEQPSLFSGLLGYAKAKELPCALLPDADDADTPAAFLAALRKLPLSDFKQQLLRILDQPAQPLNLNHQAKPLIANWLTPELRGPPILLCFPHQPYPLMAA